MDPGRPTILFVDPWDAAGIRERSAGTFGVSAAGSLRDALFQLRSKAFSVVVTELNLPDGSGLELCRGTTALLPPVLVTTNLSADAPRILKAGAAGVLLKPYEPTLLFSRVGRLLRVSDQLQERSRSARLSVSIASQKLAHLQERHAELQAGLNRSWPDTECPSCRAAEVVNFEHAAHRLAWYACLACDSVWMANEREAL